MSFVPHGAPGGRGLTVLAHPRRSPHLVLLLALLPSAAGAQGEPPVTVSTTIARVETWRDEVRAVGTVRAVRGAELSAEISGIVDEIDFDSGSEVKQGAVLFRLRPNDDEAKLAALRADADLAAANLSRDEKQFRAQAVSQATIDADSAKLRSTKAAVDQQLALMAEKTVRAPFAGKLGLRQVDLGQFVPAGTAMVTLQALDPVYVDFYVPQQALAGLVPGEPVDIAVDAYPGRTIAGSIAAISPKVDPATRMAQIRATVPNRDHALLPGMFASVSVLTGAPHQYVTLPNASISYATYGTTVYMITGNPPHAQQQVVKLGPTRGDQVAVLEGLHQGDQVVTAGQIKLRQGAAVAVNNAVQPTNDAHPTPAEE